MRPFPHIPLAACVLVGLTACVGDPQPAGPPDVSRAAFESQVYPILVRDCGFPACHGNPERFFRVYGPSRLRIDDTIELDAPPTTLEIDATFERARSMLASAESPEESLLLRKPLEVDEGGAAHMGIDARGRDVYRNRESGSWRTLLEWAGGTVPPADEGDTPEPVGTDGGAYDGYDGGAYGEYDGGAYGGEYDGGVPGVVSDGGYP